MGVFGSFSLLGGEGFSDEFSVIRGEHREWDGHGLAGVADDGGAGGVGFDGAGPLVDHRHGCFRESGFDGRTI